MARWIHSFVGYTATTISWWTARRSMTIYFHQQVNGGFIKRFNLNIFHFILRWAPCSLWSTGNKVDSWWLWWRLVSQIRNLVPDWKSFHKDSSCPVKGNCVIRTMALSWCRVTMTKINPVLKHDTVPNGQTSKLSTFHSAAWLPAKMVVTR